MYISYRIIQCNNNKYISLMWLHILMLIVVTRSSHRTLTFRWALVHVNSLVLLGRDVSIQRSSDHRPAQVGHHWRDMRGIILAGDLHVLVKYQAAMYKDSVHQGRVSHLQHTCLIHQRAIAKNTRHSNDPGLTNRGEQRLKKTWPQQEKKRNLDLDVKWSKL